jgi:hypothetical protein
MNQHRAFREVAPDLYALLCSIRDPHEKEQFRNLVGIPYRGLESTTDDLAYAELCSYLNHLRRIGTLNFTQFFACRDQTARLYLVRLG